MITIIDGLGGGWGPLQLQSGCLICATIRGVIDQCCLPGSDRPWITICCIHLLKSSNSQALFPYKIRPAENRANCDYGIIFY